MIKLCTSKVAEKHKSACLFVCFCLYLVSATVTLAQLQVVPLQLSSAQLINGHVLKARTATGALTLPFFDDFSTNKGKYPSEDRWMSTGGTLISNTHSVAHPTVNVVVLDGLNAKGIPYSYANIQVPQAADTLTSRPIDLSASLVSDSLYMSFYYQGGGLVEMPDESDTLVCQFLRADGQWNSVWKQVGGVVQPDFVQVLVGIKDRAYLHAGFQFRFISYGRITGAFDAWMLDYIYLDKNRRWNDLTEKDAAVTIPLTSYLTRYTSMPASHYILQPTKETAPIITANIYNLHSVQNVLNYEFVTKNAVTDQMLFTVTGARSEIIFPKERQSRSIANKAITLRSGQSIRLQHQFKLITSDEQNPPIAGIDLRRNDTISSYTDLSNYFAYDDGSAEYGVQMNRRLGRVAVRFIGNKSDTLAGVSMYFAPYINDIQGQRFAIQVYNDKNGQPGELLHQQAGQVSEATSQDGFIYFPFQNAVMVTDTFYIGWLQSSDTPLTVGYDRNSPLGSRHVFSSLSQDWTEEVMLEGSLMIRPRIGGKVSDVVTGNDPSYSIYLPIYPNPAGDYMYWRSDSIQSYEIIDTNGRIRKSDNVPNGTQRIWINDLDEGMYFVRLFDGIRYSTQKLLIRR